MLELSRKDKSILKKHYYSLVAHPDLCKKLFNKHKIRLKTIFYWTDYDIYDANYKPGKLQYIVMRMYDGAFINVFTDSAIMDDDFFKRNEAMLIPAPTAEEMTKLLPKEITSMVADDPGYDFQYRKLWDTTIKKEIHYMNYTSCFDPEIYITDDSYKDVKKYAITLASGFLLSLLMLLQAGHITSEEVLFWGNK